MYNVIVVDDERIIRKWLSTKLPWEDMGFVVAGECENGESALQMVMEKNPEVLVTDIKMPIMNGIELIRNIRKLGYTTKILVISGFEEFAYARESMKNGVVNYVLKPLEIDELVVSIKQIKYELDNEFERISEYYHIKKLAADSRIYTEKEFIISLKAGNDIAKTLEMMDKLEILSCYKYFCCLNILYDNLVIEEKRNNKEDIYKNVKSIINSNLEGIYSQIVPDDDNVVIFLSYISDAAVNRQELVKRIQEMEHDFNHLLASFNASVTIGLSNIHKSRMEVFEAYNEAARVEDSRFYYGKGKLYTFDDGIYDCSDEIIILPDAEKNIIDGFSIGNLQQVDDELGKVFEYFINCRKVKKRCAAKYLSHVIDLMLEKIIQLEGMDKSRIRDIYQIKSNFIETDTLMEMKEMAISAANYLTGIMDEVRSKSRINIPDVFDFIKNNVVNKELTLNEVASHVHITPKYFSFVFKKETGENFIDYVTKIKIWKAKELLEVTDKKVYYISSMLGFNDFKYFCRIFKKETGVTPTQYRIGLITLPNEEKR